MEGGRGRREGNERVKGERGKGREVGEWEGGGRERIEGREGSGREGERGGRG